MGYLYKIPDDKKIRVIIDTDAACERTISLRLRRL